MKENYYNILWADDEIETLLTEETLDILQSYHLRVIYKNNSGDARKYLEDHAFTIDAVITDANYENKADKKVSSERNMHGLYDMIPLAEKYSDRIPFFLYTQRDKSLIVNEENLAEEQVRWFEGRWFMKTDDKDEIFSKIRHDIEKINSHESQIRNRYAKEFEAADEVDEATNFLTQGLLYEYNNEWHNVQDYFNPARKIVGRIIDELMNKGILPPLQSKLNGAGNFLKNGAYELYGLKIRNLMPPPLAKMLEYYLAITQDGSHDEGDLKLHVDKYVRTSQNTNLFRTIMYITMDLLLWRKHVISDYKDTSSDDIWEVILPYSGKIEKISNGKFGSGPFELGGKGLPIGCNIEISETTRVVHNDNYRQDGKRYFVRVDKTCKIS